MLRNEAFDLGYDSYKLCMNRDPRLISNVPDFEPEMTGAEYLASHELGRYISGAAYYFFCEGWNVAACDCKLKEGCTA